MCMYTNALQCAPDSSHLWERVNPYTICTNWSLRHNGSRYTWSLPESVCVNERGGRGGGQTDPNYEGRLLRAKQRGKKSERVSHLHLNIKQCLLLTNYHFLIGTFWGYRCTEIGSVHVNHVYFCEFSITLCCFTVCVCDCKCENIALPFSATQLPSKTMLISACVNYSDGHRYTNNSDKSTGTTSQHLHKHTRSHRERETTSNIYTALGKTIWWAILKHNTVIIS